MNVLHAEQDRGPGFKRTEDGGRTAAAESRWKTSCSSSSDRRYCRFNMNGWADSAMKLHRPTGAERAVLGA